MLMNLSIGYGNNDLDRHSVIGVRVLIVGRVRLHKSGTGNFAVQFSRTKSCILEKQYDFSSIHL